MSPPRNTTDLLNLYFASRPAWPALDVERAATGLTVCVKVDDLLMVVRVRPRDETTLLLTKPDGNEYPLFFGRKSGLLVSAYGIPLGTLHQHVLSMLAGVEPAPSAPVIDSAPDPVRPDGQ